MTFKAVLTKDRRLLILRFLAEDAGYKLNTSVLQTALDAFGHSVTRDQVRVDAAWLAEQDLVRVEEVGPVAVVELTRRGADVAAGRAVVPGVARPKPGV